MTIQQLAYYVPDIEIAAREHMAIFGSGPFYLFRHVPLRKSEHRGRPHSFDHSSAYGQWGELMIEFLTVHSSDPNAVFDVFPERTGRYGMHHVALWVQDLDRAIADYGTRGAPLVQLSTLESGKEFAFVDARETLGHMVELYEADDSLTGFYAMVRNAARNWEGSDPLRELGD